MVIADWSKRVVEERGKKKDLEGGCPMVKYKSLVCQIPNSPITISRSRTLAVLNLV